MYNRIPPIFKNFYFLSSLFFVAWMLFIDSNDLITQLKNRIKISDLEEEKVFYQQQIKGVEKDRAELLTDEKMLEKFAREKYLMKKETEDLYMIVEE